MSLKVEVMLDLCVLAVSLKLSPVILASFNWVYGDELFGRKTDFAEHLLNLDCEEHVRLRGVVVVIRRADA